MGTTVPNDSGRSYRYIADPLGPRVATAIVLGGIVWVLATGQYMVAQLVAAAAWKPPYSWHSDYISDLGNTACGMFAVPHATSAYVCSPLHAVMNASFVVAGLLTIVGTVLLRRWWPAGRLTMIGLVLLVAAGLGKIVVGVVPENANAGLHLLGAFNLPVGSVAILLLSLAVRRTARVISASGVVVAGVGLAGRVPVRRRAVRGLVALPRGRRRRDGTHRRLPREPVDADDRNRRNPGRALRRAAILQCSSFCEYRRKRLRR